MKSNELPLIDHAIGHAQDNRSQLIAAFRVLAARKRRTSTNLHVRVLLEYVFAVDGGNVGIKISHANLANVLETDPNNVRYVIERAVKEFGLLESIEQRYASSAQDANLYRICWPVVRFTNAPPATQLHPPATQLHPPATQLHPPATQLQPTTNSLLVSLETTTTVVGKEDPWEVVVVALEGAGISLASRAIAGAQRLGFSPERCVELIAQWRSSEHRHTPGVLYRWLTMARSAPKASLVTPQRSTGLPAELSEISRRRRKRDEMVAANGGRPLTDDQLAELDRTT